MAKEIDKKEVLLYLKDKYVLTTLNSDSFVLMGDKISYKFNGSSVMLDIDDFNKLFKDSKFYLVEDTGFAVDDLKDKEYYERYKK